ncbi:MAG: hypothetical protein EXQ81_02770 [Thermoleophilia bacterium]|nr:hypothetical protein [Thermoleophilia bacterium]
MYRPWHLPLVVAACTAVPVLLVAVACTSVPAGASTGLTALRIDFRAGTGSPQRILTLRCAARATGTVPDPTGACRKLRRLGRAVFRPTPSDTMCSEIFGGPSTAHVTGLFLGLPLRARFDRSNGCAIARWQRVAFLLPRPAAP